MTTPTLGIRPEPTALDAPRGFTDTTMRAFQLRRERLIQNLRVGAAAQRSRGDTAYGGLLEDAADEIELLEQREETRRALHAPPPSTDVAEADGLPLLSTIRDTAQLRKIVDTAHHNGVRAGMDQASGAWVKVCKAIGLDPHTATVANVLSHDGTATAEETPPAVGDNPGTQLGGGFHPVGAVDIQERVYFPAMPATDIQVQTQDGPVVTLRGWVLSSTRGWTLRIEGLLWENLSPQTQATVQQIGEEIARLVKNPTSARDPDPVEEAKAFEAMRRAMTGV